MAGKFEITKHGDSAFTFEFIVDEKVVGTSVIPAFSNISLLYRIPAAFATYGNA